MKKNLKLIIAIIAILVIVSLLAIPKISSSGSDDSVGRQGSGNNTLAVKAHIVQAEELSNNINTSGTILANEEVVLKSETAGKIVRIAFKEGSRVNKGDLLVKINDSELQAELQSAKFKLKLLEDKEYRQKRLLEKEAISQEDYDVSLNELNITKADVDLIEARLAKTEIRAPFNGIIGLKNVSEGSYVTASTDIANLQNINPIKIDFTVPEKYASSVSIGDPVNFKTEGSSGTFTAKVYAKEPKIDPVSRTLQVRGVFDNTAGKVIPGAFASIELVLHKIENALLVPTEAVIPELKGQKVYLYKSGSVVPAKVGTGIRTDTQVQITDGLNAGDTVITSGILQIRPGAKVNISEFN